MLRRMFALFALVSLFALAACGSSVTGVETKVDEADIRLNNDIDERGDYQLAPAPKGNDEVNGPDDGSGGGGNSTRTPSPDLDSAREHDDIAP